MQNEIEQMQNEIERMRDEIERKKKKNLNKVEEDRKANLYLTAVPVKEVVYVKVESGFKILIEEKNIDELYNLLKGRFILDDEKTRFLLHKAFTLQDVEDKIVWVDAGKNGLSNNYTIYNLIEGLIEIPEGSRKSYYDFITKYFKGVAHGTITGFKEFDARSLSSSISRYSKEQKLRAKSTPSASDENVEMISSIVNQLT